MGRPHQVTDRPHKVLTDLIKIVYERSNFDTENTPYIPCTERSHILCLGPPDTYIQAAQGPALCDLLWRQQEVQPGT